jgi:hypothetical protein
MKKFRQVTDSGQAMREAGQPSRRRTPLLGAAALAIAVAVAIAAGVYSSQAGALNPQIASENINAASVPLGYSGNGLDTTWTNLGSVALASGSSDAVFATVYLHETGGNFAGVPATAECGLSLPDEPIDYADAALVGETTSAKSTYTAGVSLEGLTQLYSAFGTPISGSANLYCRVTSPGAAGLVVASDARLLTVPVDAAINNLNTLGCKPGQFPPC